MPQLQTVPRSLGQAAIWLMIVLGLAILLLQGGTRFNPWRMMAGPQLNLKHADNCPIKHGHFGAEWIDHDPNIESTEAASPDR